MSVVRWTTTDFEGGVSFGKFFFEGRIVGEGQEQFGSFGYVKIQNYLKLQIAPFFAVCSQ
jgi:hypothetical protein